MTGSDQNPTRWLAPAAAGDAGAWRELVEAYSPRLFGLLLRQCGDRELAEELTQETFVKVLTRLGQPQQYKEQGKFEPWLFRIAMNQLRDEMRRRRRQATPFDFSDSGLGEPATDGTALGSDPFEHANRAEQIERLRQAVALLGPADQKILHLRHTAGLSFPQIAESLQEPIGTVLARGHRAVAKLKKMLGEPRRPA